MLKEGENAGLAVSGIVLIIIVCPLSSLKIQYYTTITGTILLGLLYVGLSVVKLVDSLKICNTYFFFFLNESLR